MDLYPTDTSGGFLVVNRTSIKLTTPTSFSDFSTRVFKALLSSTT
jgi:hypothetical protein